MYCPSGSNLINFDVDNACICTCRALLLHVVSNLFVAMVMLMMVVVVVSPGVCVSPVEPTIATVRVEHCNKSTNTQMENIVYKKMDFRFSF